MNKIDFEVSQDLFQSKPTEASYLVSAKKGPKYINATYIDIDQEGNIIKEDMVLYDNVLTRRILKQEIRDTYLKILDINDWQHACAIYEIDRKLYDVNFSKKVCMFFSAVGLSSAVIFGKGLSMLHYQDSAAYGYLIVGGTLIIISLNLANRLSNLIEECKNLKQEQENILLDRVNQLVRKK